jgi:hypothetical protein
MVSGVSFSGAFHSAASSVNKFTTATSAVVSANWNKVWNAVSGIFATLSGIFATLLEKSCFAFNVAKDATVNGFTALKNSFMNLSTQNKWIAGGVVGLAAVVVLCAVAKFRSAQKASETVTSANTAVATVEKTAAETADAKTAAVTTPVASASTETAAAATSATAEPATA